MKSCRISLPSTTNKAALTCASIFVAMKTACPPLACKGGGGGGSREPSRSVAPRSLVLRVPMAVQDEDTGESGQQTGVSLCTATQIIDPRLDECLFS